MLLAAKDGNGTTVLTVDRKIPNGSKVPEVFDTHAHLCSRDFDADREEVAAGPGRTWALSRWIRRVSSADTLRLAGHYGGICSWGFIPITPG